MVSELLDELIADSPDAAFERASLPKGIEEKLAKVDWSVRDVLIGSLRSREQLGVCLRDRFYHIPASRIRETDFPIRCVAIYKSRTIFGAESGISSYGEVTRCSSVRRCDIKELPSESDELYFRFDIKEWKTLPRPIAVKERASVRDFTNLFLLEHGAEMPELWLRSEEEYRLYSELKRKVNDAAINDEDANLGFFAGDAIISFEGGYILIIKQNRLAQKYAIQEFTRSPGAVFRGISKVLAERIVDPASLA